MKLYLSSYCVPTPNDLAELIGKPLADASVALIPNAKDYYSTRAWNYKRDEMVVYLQSLGLKVETVDLRKYSDPATLMDALSKHDLIWARGGNTYMLREAMRNSGFDEVIAQLLESGVVYGGDSAGALVAGLNIAGVETADEPEFAEQVILEGLNLVPFVILPHADNPEFAEVCPIFRQVHKDKKIIELKDSQAVIFVDDTHRIVTGQNAAQSDVS